MKLNVFVKQMPTNKSDRQDQVMKVGKKQLEKLIKQGVPIQFFTRS